MGIFVVYITKLYRKLIALIKGTFISDCPRCHKHFYGTDPHGVQLKFGKKHYRIVCHHCHEEHKLLK